LNGLTLKQTLTVSPPKGADVTD